MKFSNYFEPTPKNVQKWLLALKSIIGTVSASAFMGGHETAAFFILTGGAVINELANLIGNGNQSNSQS